MRSFEVSCVRCQWKTLSINFECRVAAPVRQCGMGKPIPYENLRVFRGLAVRRTVCRV